MPNFQLFLSTELCRCLGNCAWSFLISSFSVLCYFFTSKIFASNFVFLLNQESLVLWLLCFCQYLQLISSAEFFVWHFLMMFLCSYRVSQETNRINLPCSFFFFFFLSFRRLHFDFKLWLDKLLTHENLRFTIHSDVKIVACVLQALNSTQVWLIIFSPKVVSR